MSSKKKLILAIDFDGTIVTHDYPRIGELKPNAKNTINKWYDEGHYIIIWSCRYNTEKEDAEKFLKENGINFHTFNENIEYGGDFKPHPKVFAHLYIDDKGFRFTDDEHNWEYLSKQI